MSATSLKRDPSRVSYYFDDPFYERMVRISKQLRAGPVGAEVDGATERAVARALYREARLIDDDRLEEWLGLFVPECAYWIPATLEAADPRRQVTIELHDRRRLEDRVVRLRTGTAASWAPPIRTRHSLSSLEIWKGDGECLLARANSIVQTFVLGHHRTLGGWCGYALLNLGGEWKIEIKQINLIDCDYGQENNSFCL